MADIDWDKEVARIKKEPERKGDLRTNKQRVDATRGLQRGLKEADEAEAEVPKAEARVKAVKKAASMPLGGIIMIPKMLEIEHELKETKGRAKRARRAATDTDIHHANTMLDEITKKEHKAAGGHIKALTKSLDKHFKGK
jgi:hypothetical protein